MFSRLSLLGLALASRAFADQVVYTGSVGALSAGWENWSWSCNITWASTSGPGGVPAAYVEAGVYAGFSLYDESSFANYAGLRFDISGAQPDLTLAIQATGDNAASPNIPLSSLSTTVTAAGWTTVTINFASMPPAGTLLGNDTWNRIAMQAGGSGTSFYINNIMLLDEIVVTPKFLSAEPLPGNVVAVTTQGAVDFSQVSVQLNNKPIAISSKSSYTPSDTPSQTITYLTLAKPLAQGSLNITAGANSFVYTLPAVEYGTITVGNKKPISPFIYGVNFPTDANYIKTLGVTMSRWGGNAVTAYNPNGDFTNAGADWYFENRVASPASADDWIGWTRSAGSQSMVTIPALDWVAKDASSYSYPKSLFPDQKSFDPYTPDAGDGTFSNGTALPPADPTRAYTPWNTSMAANWLVGLKNKPDIVTVDNEIEIASSTHQDMHPVPMGFDEELARVINTAVMAKQALPNVKVAAPSTCAWWFYWTSSVGYNDNAAHNNMDFIPWFLQQMAAHDKKAGKRYLDYLDIHYYYAPDTSANDAAAKALRLRMDRSLYDPTYTDESWIGTSVPSQWKEANPNAVWLIPRMQQLIQIYYPGTKLSISEWSSGADSDITGGLLTADVLGIYGRYGVDSATYWSTPDEMGPTGLAYWLYNGNGVTFGANSVQVNMANTTESVLGVYAATTDGAKVSLVIINKDVKPVALAMSNIPAGTYLMKHFGGASGVAKWQTTVKFTSTTSNYIVVPAYAAVLLKGQ